IGKLREAGLGDEVDSWVANGDNKPVDPQRLGEALGPDTVKQMAAGSGIDIMSLLPMLAAFLPQIISMLTPKGTTPEGGLDNAVGSGGLGDLGGLLGGLMGGGAGGAGGGGAGLDDLLGGLGGMLGGDKGR
ncbi:MAG TPA: YidB family protein, partial [Candidatus Limnocylindrales bacterium]|nr:YidB family protein [Candidatus Limnocylindrales bacterium]